MFIALTALPQTNGQQKFGEWLKYAQNLAPLCQAGEWHTRNEPVVEADTVAHNPRGVSDRLRHQAAAHRAKETLIGLNHNRETCAPRPQAQPTSLRIACIRCARYCDSSLCTESYLVLQELTSTSMSSRSPQDDKCVAIIKDLKRVNSQASIKLDVDGWR